jgi:hypothetical protein
MKFDKHRQFTNKSQSLKNKPSQNCTSMELVEKKLALELYVIRVVYGLFW